MRRLLLPVLLCSTMAAAGKVYTAVVTYESGHYVVEVDALVEVAESRARELLTDYNHLDRVNPAVEVSEILDDRGSGDYRVRTVPGPASGFSANASTRSRM